VTFAPSGRQFLTASDDGTMRLWDVVSGLEVRCLKRLARVLCVALSRTAAGRFRGTWTQRAVWDLEIMEKGPSPGEAPGPVSAVAFAPDGRTAFSGSLDQTVRRWTRRRGSKWASAATTRHLQPGGCPGRLRSRRTAVASCSGGAGPAQPSSDRIDAIPSLEEKKREKNRTQRTQLD